MPAKDFLAEDEPQTIASSSKVYDGLVDYDGIFGDSSIGSSSEESIDNSSDEAAKEVVDVRTKKLTVNVSQASTSMKPKVPWLPNRDEEWTEESGTSYC